MTHARNIMETHPRGISVDMAIVIACITECFDCAQTCITCADACLGEKDIRPLVRCIRLDLDCADICNVTGLLVSRQTETDWVVLSAQLQACATACQVCGEECRKHAEHHTHCKICAEACDRCGQACKNLIAALPQLAVA
jgi:hypothetical protein